MLENQLSRYGAISRNIPNLAPGAKVFLVSDSDDTTVGPLNIGNEFPVDKDGVTRVYTTIQAASNAASASRGDVVVPLPGYDHTLARADSWTTAGIHIIGIGEGENRPTIRFGAVTDAVNVGANYVHIENLRFVADADSVTLGLDLDTGFGGAHIENCVFDWDSNAQNFVTMLRNGQDNAVIENNQFRAEDTAGTQIGVLLRAGIYPTVKNNFFYGQFDSVGSAAATAAGAIVSDTTGAAMSGVNISDNTIVSSDTAAALLINIDAALTHRGTVRGNKLATYDTATADTAQVSFGTLLPLDNTMITGDSDVQQSVVGKRLMRGVLDSG